MLSAIQNSEEQEVRERQGRAVRVLSGSVSPVVCVAQLQEHATNDSGKSRGFTLPLAGP